MNDDGSSVTLSAASSDSISLLDAKFAKLHSLLAAHSQRILPAKKALDAFNVDLQRLSKSLYDLQQQHSGLAMGSGPQREAIERAKSAIIDLMLPPQTIRLIISDPINPQWTAHLQVINDKLLVLAAVESLPALAHYRGSVALENLETCIRLVTCKAVERIRDYIIVQIKRLRANASAPHRAQASSQTVQQDLLATKLVQVFLRTHHPALAHELMLAYFYTMRWYYRSRFARYAHALEQLGVKRVDASLVLDTPPPASWLAPQQPLAPQALDSGPVPLAAFLLSLDKRESILRSETRPAAIPAQIAETSPFSYWIEFVFHQWQVAVMDNVIVEYLFVTEFFYDGSEALDKVPVWPSGPNQDVPGAVATWPQVVFGDIFSMGSDFTSWLIQHSPSSKGPGRVAAARTNFSASSGIGSGDAYGILLMIRIVQLQQQTLGAQLHIPVMNDYLHALLLLLWPHFSRIIDINCDLMKKMASQRGTVAHSLAPVAVTQQFAQYLLGLLKLASPPKEIDYRGEPLYTLVNRMCSDFETLLTRISNFAFGTKRGKAAEKEIFLRNNYFLVVSILKGEISAGQAGETHPMIKEEIAHFQGLCDAYSQ